MQSKDTLICFVCKKFFDASEDVTLSEDPEFALCSLTCQDIYEYVEKYKSE